MKRVLTSFLFIFSLLSFTISLERCISIYQFNHISVKNTISYLSSKDLNGRLAGTFENNMAAAYIKTQFQNNELLPYNNSYYNTFTTTYPNRTEGRPRLQVMNKDGKVVKGYSYSIDFKEDMINFIKNEVVFTKKDMVRSGDSMIQIKKGEDFFVFYATPEDNLNFRSSFLNSEPYIQSMYIMLTKQTFTEISEYISKGYTVDCFIPFVVEETSLNNIVGYIEGRDITAPPIILSAHFDHLGSDLTGKVYGGALDNASGISFVLETIKYIKSLGKPDRNIMFIGFNAEEFGCLGSKHFVEENRDYLRNAKVYNFDMIGSNNHVPLSIMAGKKDTVDYKFLKSIEDTCDAENIQYSTMFEDSSDHEYFRKYNIDAVTFCDNDVSRIHTPEDKPQYIDNSSIDRTFKVISKEIIKYGYDNNPLLIYYEKLFQYSALMLFLFSVLYALCNRFDDIS